MKTFSKILSVILAITLMLSVTPLSLFQVHADEFTWNNNATMTLTTNNVEVIPTQIIETDDTKLKIYTIDSDKPYTLTTSDDNDYGVVFDIVWAKTTDEYGIDRYDDDIDVTLDNVTIKTKNPRQGITVNNYAAMNFCSTTAFYTSNSINIIAVGTNTIELLGVKNDTANDNWSAISSTNDMLVFRGDGILNAGCTYDNAIGSVAAIRNEYTVYTKDTVTLNATANVTNASSEAVGHGILFSSYGLVVNIDTKVNIIANKYGVYNTATSSPNLFMFGDMNIKAGERGISWESSSISVGDDVTLTIEGLTDATSPKVAVITKRGFSVGSNCTVNIKALNEALSCKATTVEDHSAPVYIGENSVVNLSGSFESPVFALDCGLDGGSNNYWVSYPASDLDLADNAKLTVNAGYLAIQAYTLDMMSGSSLDVTTTKQVDSSNAYDYAPVRLYTNSYIESGATININSAAKSAIYSGKLHLKSNNIFIKALEEVFAYTSFTRYENVYTFECDDGINWVPFDSSSKGKAYFTTRNVENHICYGSKWTQVDDTYTHSTTCIYCGKTITDDCVWDRGVWSYVSSGVYELKFTCTICKAVKISDVDYHTHTYGTYTPFVDKYGQFKHEGFCTYDGCEASTEEYCSNSLSNEYHKTPTLLVRDCTKCGQCATTTEIEAGTSTHFEAKTATCCTPGNIEYYNCGHCNQYYADESFTTKLSPTDVFTTPTAHNYDADGVCTVCGNKEQNLSFFELDEFPYDYHEYNCIIVGKTEDGTMYVLGNETTDGKRNAVEITSDKIDENGNIRISSADAEYLLYDNMNSAFVVDGGYLSLLNGEIYVYDTARKSDANISIPAEYQVEDYYDESGLGYMQAYISGKYAEREFLIFNEETLKFEVSDTQVSSLYLYVEQCEHQSMSHNKAVAATCTEQGVIEYWYCGKCHEYYSNAQGTALLEIPEDVYSVDEYLTQPALGHNYNNKDICENCGIKRPVYKQVSTLEDFDKLSDKASYIIVIKDGDKTYAASLPNMQNPCDTDSDGDGIVDAIEIDENGNTIPDCFEVMYNNWGMGDYNGDEVIDENDYKEWIGDLNEDGKIAVEDYIIFLEYNYWDISYYYEEAAMSVDNFVEVNISADGSITVVDEGAMEFQMMISGVWGGQPPIDGGYESDWEYYDILDTERIRAAWVPNLWIANSGLMGSYSEDHFMTQYRIYGDSEYPGIIDNKNWKISFNEDGTACLVSTWADLNDSAALQFVKYTDADGNENMTIVGLYGDQWEYSDIMLNKTASLPVYLFACEAEYDHTHTWGDWTSDDTTDTHTRKCTLDGCPITQTENHAWDDGVETQKPTCTTNGVITYTCSVCNATKTQTTNELGHNWSDWEYDSVDSHVRYCKRNCGTEEFGGHEWGEPIQIDDTTHKIVCSICNGERTEDHSFGDFTDDGNDATHTKECACGATVTAVHNYDDGTIVEQPTHTENGIKTFTCTDCGYSYTEDIPTTPEHSWSDWYSNQDGTHSRACRCNATETNDCEYDDGVITEQPTHTEAGIKTYTCTVCGHTYDEDIPLLTDHEWGDWVVNKLDEANTHVRFCICQESQTAPHNFNDGVVTLEPTHIRKGEMTFTCNDCGYCYTEEIPTTPDHTWSDWYSNDDGTHSRSCRCNATETSDCQYDGGIITEHPTHTEAGIKTFTCTVCGHTYDQEVPKLTEHTWGDWGNTNDGYHQRECKCGAIERELHAWSDWTKQANSDIYTRECDICDATEQMQLDSDKPVNATPADNAANTDLSNSDIELIDKVLTNEEQSQVAAGAQVSIYLKVEDITNDVAESEKTATEEAAGDNQIGMYLDIDMFKNIDGDEKQVSETSGTVTITITIPEELLNTNSSITRTYQIIRVHDDGTGVLVVDVIDGIYNPDDNTFTFQTDKFSTYALVVVDQADDINYGDVNEDEKVNNKDLGVLIQYINGWNVIVNETAADVNGDGKINNKDYGLLMQYINGWDVTLGKS